MLSLFGGWKIFAAGVLVSLVTGFASGVWVRDAFCDAAAAKLQVLNLTKQLEARDAAATQDQAKAQEALERASQLEEQIREAERKVSAGECLSADDNANSLQHLWKR